MLSKEQHGHSRIYKIKDFFLRFPNLVDDILNNLDDENLAKMRQVERHWRLFLDNGRLIWKRIIYKYLTGIDNTGINVKGNWNTVIKKANNEMIKKLGLAVEYHLTILPLESDDDMTAKKPRFPL